ncbi:MAG: DNA-processing protein DprA [Actinomycetota bacterium]|nr:DNA-processing protein DprA [Actinomycetota bacterium]
MKGHEIRPGTFAWPPALDDLTPKGRPSVLFADGEHIPPKEQCLAIVGTRNASVTGLELTRRFARAFAEAGYTIVSGFARGVDTAAHRTALESGGSTIAVLGCGLDVSYPPRNDGLKTQIRQRGTLMTEYPMGTKPEAFHFPARNRLIAALAMGTLVVEGGSRSGALITARLAFDLGRIVWAVPGSPWTPKSEASNYLIRSNMAALVTCPDHVFEDIAPSIAWTTPYNVFKPDRVDLDEEKLRVLSALDDTPRSADEISAITGHEPGRDMLLLATLEVRGLVARSRSGGFLISEGGGRALGAALGNSDGAARATRAPQLPHLP